jgi:hypothetical protein
VAAEARRREDGALALHYLVEGDVARLRLPEPIVPERTDGLWQHTCFEAFVGAEPGGAYHELNFSPSSAWAAYAFTGYRAGMRPDPMIPAPRIVTTRAPGRLHVDVEAHITVPAGSRHSPMLALALSAVLEDADGCLSYWALRHPASRPDFHHPGGFVLTLPALGDAVPR